MENKSILVEKSEKRETPLRREVRDGRPVFVWKDPSWLKGAR